MESTGVVAEGMEASRRLCRLLTNVEVRGYHCLLRGNLKGVVGGG